MAWRGEYTLKIPLHIITYPRPRYMSRSIWCRRPGISLAIKTNNTDTVTIDSYVRQYYKLRSINDQIMYCQLVPKPHKYLYASA